jgi:hypothetical protein
MDTSIVCSRSAWNANRIRGLSLTRPWPFAFTEGPQELQKRVENRSWKPPRTILGQYVALHSAKSWSEEDRDFIAEAMGLTVPRKSDFPHSEIFAVCRVMGYATSESQLPPLQQVWFFGPYGWLLTNFVKLVRPVPCAGALSLWSFDDKPEVLELLRDSYRDSIRRAA